MAARNVNKNYFVIIVIELTQDLFQLFDRVFSGAPNHGGGDLRAEADSWSSHLKNLTQICVPLKHVLMLTKK